MDNLERLIRALLLERGEKGDHLPQSMKEKRALLRTLMNVRQAVPLSPDILEMQDSELQKQKEEKGVVDVASIAPSPRDPRLRLWLGDITRLNADAIVNAGNSSLLGCFIPQHNCIDNVIHSAAGMQLREECAKIMAEAGGKEPRGHARITSGYNLPAKHVLHTVGPMVKQNTPTDEDKKLLASCYTACMEKAAEAELASIAFCCISTGVFRFSQKEAARIAIESVLEYFARNPATPIDTVIFDVFRDDDLKIYRELLGHDPV